MLLTRSSERPPPSSEHARLSMRANRSVDSKLEVKIRSALHRAGLRFFKNRVVGEVVRTRADIVFSKARIVVFVDGCFWHFCPEHGQLPVANGDFWQAKFARNQQRDRCVTESLESEGWSVVRIWEHEPIERAVAKVKKVLTASEDSPNSSHGRITRNID